MIEYTGNYTLSDYALLILILTFIYIYWRNRKDD